MRIDKNTTIRLGDRNIVKIKIGDSVIWQKTTGPEPVVGPDYFYIENTYAGENTITFTTAQMGTPNSYTYAKSVEYSTDKKNWNTLTFNTSTPQTITIGVGEKLYLRNDSGGFNYYEFASFYTKINTSQNCVVGGNINTLINYNDADNVSLRGYYGCFYMLFKNAKNITDASNLIIPSTNIVESYCREMFSGCTSLQNAPTLSATTLGKQCYYEMFYECSKLTTAPALPATSLASYCYGNMFNGCKSLTTAPTLPATTLVDNCYFNMFGGCTSLTTAPELPATTLASSCYYEMFNSCKSLTTAPTLPATTLADYCYERMFQYCTSLVNAPALPVTKLAPYCYNNMFNGCTSLTTAPELPATTLTTSCYYGMFSSCSKLNSITVYADDISATDCTTNWLSGVSSTGTFNNYGSATYTANSPSGIPSGWTEVKPVVGPDYFYIESLGDGNTVSVINKGNGDTTNVTPTLEYSTDKNTWNTITFDWTSGEHTTELPVKLNTGGKMYFRNDTHLFSNSSSKYIKFSSTVSSNVGGDIRTLSNYLDVDNETKPQSYMFYRLFDSNKNIVDASNLRLPYTSLADNCYQLMFNGCNSLTTAPELPATTLANGCYQQMFGSCYKLTTAPELPATTLASNCYAGMFYMCSKLTTAPTLPSTTLAMGCYDSMFAYCYELNNITVYADDISAFNCTSSWVYSVASTGTFHNLGTATYEKNSINGIPSGWTEVKN